MAQGRLGLAKRGGREIEQHIDLVRLQRGYGIGTSQAVALQFLLNPEVFADGETQRPAATSLLELQNGGLVCRLEIAPFVKDVVGGQQLFAGDDAPLATCNQGDGVEQIGFLGCRNRFGHAHQQGQVGVGGRQLGGELIQDVVLGAEQGRSQQQIPGRITPEGKLRGDHQIRVASCRFLASRQNSGSIASQISHQGIDLGQGDAHQQGGSARP